MDVAGDVGPVNLAWANSPELVSRRPPHAWGSTGTATTVPCGVHQEMAPWQGTAMAIDPAGRGGDELAYAVGHMLHSRIFVPRGGRGLPGGYSEENLKASSRWPSSTA
jgi:hypothetical protein